MTLIRRIKGLTSHVPPLSYAITRDVTIPHLSFFVLVGGLVLVIILSLIGVATTGYEYSPVTLSNCNETKDMWYDFMNLGNWITPSILCQPSILKPGDGILVVQLHSNAVLITDSSGSLSPSYEIQGFVDPRSNQFNGMSYRNNALNNCSVEYVIGWDTISPAVPPYGNNAEVRDTKC